MYVFSKEITDWRRAGAIHVNEQPGGQLPLSRLQEQAQQALGGDYPISWTNVYNRPDKSMVFYAYAGNPGGLTYFSTVTYYKSVYVDPYTGNVKAIYDEKADFFSIVKMLHWSLLLKTEIGQPIVGWSTLIFVVLLITGLVLWWPKSFKSAGNLFRIRWKKSTKSYRKMYDLHNILGFYSLFFALIIALTGMVWAFKWFQALVYVAAAGTTTPPAMPHVQSVPAPVAVVAPVDRALEQTRRLFPDAAGFRVSVPADSTGTIALYIQHKAGLYYKTSQLQFDQYSGDLLDKRAYRDKNAGEKLIAANYDIHVGAIGGIPGKILAFVISLVCATLPVTGFLMWWKRTRKKKRKRVLPVP
jgi:uncharacterized iron-regulated membrane protein